ncbi:MAG: metallophosphoesterase [Solobacterium sp.]|nr:metallophosphoesterase [Solobacterium sp.]
MNAIWLIPAGVIGAAVCAGLPRKIDITKYAIRTDKVKNMIRIAVLSDLHNEDYGENMEKLTVPLMNEHPDLILMPGDMAEERHHQDNTLKMMRAVSHIPSFYSTGNHEEYRRDLPELKKQIAECGVRILSGEAAVTEINGTRLEICGIPCRRRESLFDADEISSLFRTDSYRILLSHRPHWVTLYGNVNCDLVVSGHAHGGQWCIPGTHVGIKAPNQRLFSKYTCGIHDLKKGKLLISRGLVKDYHHIPRLYNNPEIVILTLLPEEQK